MEGEQARIFIMTIAAAFVWITETTMGRRMVGEMVKLEDKRENKSSVQLKKKKKMKTVSKKERQTAEKREH